MGPFTLAVDAKSSSGFSPDASNKKMKNLQLQSERFFASVNVREEKPFDFLRTLFDGIIAGGTAGVVVETALYPIDTIKTRLQAAHGGGKIVLKGLYSGLAGNLVGVLPGGRRGRATSQTTTPVRSLVDEDEESTDEREFDDDVLKDDYSDVDENMDDGDGDEMTELESE